MPTIGVYNSEQKQWADKGGYLSLTLTRVDGGKSLNAGYSYNYSGVIILLMMHLLRASGFRYKCQLS